MWQIDFKGYFETSAGKCHPLTLLDDHSRFNLTLSGCAQADTPSVQAHLQRVFKRYGLPLRIDADNGGPWGTPRATQQSISVLNVWLIRLGTRVTHWAWTRRERARASVHGSALRCCRRSNIRLTTR